MPSLVFKTRAFSFAAGSVVALLAACSQDALGPDSGSVESVAITPSTATVSVGASMSLSAEVRDANGALLPEQRVSWASEDASIAAVNASGVVTGRKVGSVLIAASSWGKDAFARVTVYPTPVAALRLSTTNRSMMVGQTFQLTAETLDDAGQVMSGRPITWSTSAPAVATVTENGLVSAVATGGAIITASSEGKSAVASITVATIPVASVVVAPVTANLVVGQTTQLSAQLRDASGGALTGRAVTWSSNRVQVATVTSEGLVTAVGEGTATISATSEGSSATATVNVSPRPASAVIVSPGQVTLFTGQTVQLSALVTDDRGQVLTGRPIAYVSSNSQVATVSSAGLVTAIAPGAATISVTSEGATGTAAVTVASEPVATVDVTPSSASIAVGNGVQLTATPRNAAGQPLTGHSVTWTTGAPGLASVSSSGLVTGLAPGNAVIYATVDGRQGSALITVRPVAVASVSVTPSPATVVRGQTVTLTATPRDASGNPLAGRVVGWQTSASAIATVSAGGVVTGVAVGTATITATSEGQSGSSTVTVTIPVPVATVTVTPSPVNLVVGGTQTVTATLRDAAGNVLTGRVVTWGTANASVATVSQSGLISATGVGTTTVTATSEGASGSTAVTVTPVPVASVTVAPSTVSLVVGGTQTVVATPRDAAGNALTGRVVTWSSADSSVATVNQSGVITAAGVGATTVTATCEGKTAAVTVNVAARQVTTITVAPTPVTVNVAWTQQLTATAYDQIGNVMTGVSFTWTTSSSAIATVSSSGVVTGVAVGSATITAGSGTVTGTAAVTVQLAPVDRIVVTPNNPTINEGQTVQLTATLYDAQDHVLTGRTVTWSSADATKVSVTNTGLASGLKKGTVVVSASSGGKSGTTSVKVQ